MRKLLVLFLLASSAFAQQQVQPVAGVLTLNLIPGTSSFKVILSANVTSVVIQNPTPGTIISVIFTENATGGFTVVFGGNIANPCAVNTSASVTTTCQFQYDATSNTWNGIGGGGAGPNSPLPAATSGPGPVFNVKNYGAKGDLRNSVNASINGSTITCSDCNFTQADVNRSSSMSNGVYATIWSNVLITAVTNSTTATVAGSFGSGSGVLSWGTIDDTAVSNAVTAFLAAAQQQNQGGVLGITAAAPTLYFPAGNYGLLNTAIFLNPATAKAGLTIKGDGSYQSRITALTGYVPTRLLVIANLSFVTVQGLTIDGMKGSAGAGNNAVDTSSSTNFLDVVISGFAGNGLNASTAGLYVNGATISNNNGIGFTCTPCNGEIENTTFTNNQGNIAITGTSGVPGGFGLKFVAVQQDECGSHNCMVLTNSQDIWLVGGSFLGTSSQSAIQVDGQSYLHINGGLVGPFAQDTNGSGLLISSRGVVEASDTRFISTGTGKCINNSGTFINNGANTCESQFNVISAAASSGTTATLTVTTQGANVSAVCAVNDSVYVQNVGVAGYNGFFKNAVTAVGTNTLAYTTPGSNLGASSGGSVFCRSYNNFTGTLPYSTLTPTPNTCYVTGTFGAITLCNQFIDRAINVYHIKASSGVTTACTVAPVVTISDGTNSATLTITTAKATWDSSVDASTNVGTLIFTPDGGTLTVSTTAGTCTTPPTNFALTYTMQGVLDN